MFGESELAILMGSLGIIFGVVFIILLAILIPVIIAEWMLFKKAGKKGWEVFVPFYNTWVLIEIAGLNWWYFLISMGLSLLSWFSGEDIVFVISLLSYYINFIIYYNIAKRTKQNEILFGILGVFVPYVAVLILGFSKSITYDDRVEVSPNGVF